MAGVIGITGGPGTGKKSVSPLVARKLKLRCLGINDLALSYGLLKPGDQEGTVDTRIMRSRLERDVVGPALIYGHLLPYVVDREGAERVVVLRCEPAVLKGRLIERGYPLGKVAENVEAELIGVVSADAYEAFGSSKTFEFDTTGSVPSAAANEVAEIAVGSPGARERIDWMNSYDSGEKLRSLLSDRR